jgi:hypothetical protein
MYWGESQETSDKIFRIPTEILTWNTDDKLLGVNVVMSRNKK